MKISQETSKETEVNDERLNKTTFVIEQIISKGGFGQIYKGKEQNSGKSFALKIFDETKRNSFLIEKRILKLISKNPSKFLIKMIGYCKNTFKVNNKGPFYCIILDLHGPSLSTIGKLLENNNIQ